MKKGCFNWYLFHSGSYVTTIAKAIQLADLDNLNCLGIIYPQMIAAFKMNSWDEVPEGIEPIYNARYKRIVL